MAPIVNLASLILSLLTWAVAKKFQYENQKESMGREGNILKCSVDEQVAYQKQSKSSVKLSKSSVLELHILITFIVYDTPCIFFACRSLLNYILHRRRQLCC